MKTLIFNGSPRKKGDTASLIKHLQPRLSGETKIVNAYYDQISPCMDCRYCWKHSGCCVKDEMQEVYAFIQECDNILIASPVYFSELTGKLLDVGSRLQTYFCAKYFRRETPIPKAKKAAVLLVGGGKGNMEKAYDTAQILLKDMNATEIFPLVSYHNTDEKVACEDPALLAKLDEVCAFFQGKTL